MWVISCKNTRYSVEVEMEKKVEKTCKKWLTLVSTNGIMVKLTRERQQKTKENKKVLDKAERI